MTDETRKIKKRPVIDMIFRLLCVYVAATSFFTGLQDLRDSAYLKAGMDFSLVILELGLIFSWHRHKSKIVQMLPWIATGACFVFLVLTKL